MPEAFRRRAAIAGAAILLAAVCLVWVHAARDMERLELDDPARQAAPGSFVALSSGQVHYELGGSDSARTVVLVHGFSVPYYIWDSTFARLTENGYRVLRFDLFGRGYSDRPRVRYDQDLYVRQLAELLDELGVGGRVDVVGLSMGGIVAARFVHTHAERTRSLVLVDPAVSEDARAPLMVRTPLVGEYLMTMMAPRLAADQLGDFLHPERYPDWAERYREQMRYSGFRRAILSTLRSGGARNDSLDYARVGSSSLPVLLIWGRQDATVPFAESERVRRLIPQAQFVPVDSAGHLPHIERPDVVYPALLRFLADTGSRDALSRR